MIFKHAQRKGKSKGQAMVEFGLVLPLLMLLILGIFDFGRVLFTYAQTSYYLRNALRYAAVLGEASGGTHPIYLRCGDMADEFDSVLFDSSMTVTVSYEKSDGSPIGNCVNNGDVSNNAVSNGDMLKIQVTAVVDFVAIPLPGFNNLTMDFRGQRTLVKSIDYGSTFQDEEQDGLNDFWELSYFGRYMDSTNPTDIIDLYNAIDDPDGDGCNNGCEESRGTDPKVPDVKVPLPETFFSVPNPVLSFKVDPDCAGNVAITWTNNGTGPIPNGYAVYELMDNRYTVLVNGNASSPVNLSGVSTGAAHSYFVVPFKDYVNIDGDTVRVYGKASAILDANCTAPDQPAIFGATLNNCGTPQVMTFRWEGGDNWSPGGLDKLEIMMKKGSAAPVTVLTYGPAGSGYDSDEPGKEGTNAATTRIFTSATTPMVQFDTLEANPALINNGETANFYLKATNVDSTGAEYTVTSLGYEALICSSTGTPISYGTGSGGDPNMSGGVSGYAYRDLNSNGVYDAGTDSFAKTDVTLYQWDGSAWASSMTTAVKGSGGGAGEYSFEGLLPGLYQVVIEAGDYPSGVTTSQAPQQFTVTTVENYDLNIWMR